MTAPAPFFVPAAPTLWPGMLLRPLPRAPYHPFSASRVSYYYFARNAIWHTVKVLGLEGADVLVPAYHHGVEIEALVDAGARMAFYRVGANWNVDLEDVERKITGRTRALYLTHYAGFAGPVLEMRQIADRHGLPLIEDCALSLLASHGGEPLGSRGDVGIFCLYKALPVPNGGAIVINDGRGHVYPEPGPAPVASTASHALGSLLQNLEMRAGAPGRALRRLVRRLGRQTVSAANIARVATGSLHFNRAHLPLGMSALTRRIALRQDARAIVEQRRRNYRHLAGELGEISPPLVRELPEGAAPLFYPLLVNDKAPVMAALEARGIETVDFWRFFHPACNPSDFPEVAALRNAVLEIPCHQDLDDAVMARVAATTREVLLACEPQRRTMAGGV